MERQISWGRVVLVGAGAIVALYLVWLMLKLVFWLLSLLCQGLAYCLLGIIVGLCYIGPYIGPVFWGLIFGALMAVPLYMVLQHKKRYKVPMYVICLLLMVLSATKFTRDSIFIEHKLEPAKKVFDSGDLYGGLEMRNHSLADNGYIMLGDWRTDGLGRAIYFRCPWLSRYREPVVMDFTPQPEW